MYSRRVTQLGPLSETHKNLPFFFPNGDPRHLPGVCKMLQLTDVGDAPEPYPNCVIACDEMEYRFEQERYNYAAVKLAREFRPRTMMEGEEFPVKSWLHGKWEPPLEGGEEEDPKQKMKPKQKRKKRKVNEGRGGSASQSQHQDELMLLRNDGKKVDLDSLENKYILVCFFFVPTLVKWESVSQRLLELSSELFARGENYTEEFEIVLVVKMRNGWGNSEEAFNHFVHAFPPRCLAVPFQPSSHRERLFDSSPFYDFPAALLVGPEGKVLQGEISDTFFNFYGSAQCYPFTDEAVERVCEEEHKVDEMLTSGLGFRSHPLPPDNLLSHPPRDFDLHHSLDPQKHIKLSQLISKSKGKGKHLWFYVCQTGTNLLRILVKIYKQCKIDLDFDVVLVYSMCEANLSGLMKIINRALVENEISCWILPFDNSVSHRLWRLCDQPSKDKLICVESNGKYADPFAAEVFLAFGVDAYPFTRGHIISKEYERLKKVNLYSLLSESQANVFDANGTRVPVSQLASCNILVYFESSMAYRKRAGESYPKRVYDKVSKKEWHKTLMKNFPLLKVVFVCFNDIVCNLLRGQMRWLVCPFNNTLIASVTRQLSVMGRFPDGNGCLMSSREGGHLCSILAHQRLLQSDTEDLFVDHVRQDIVSALMGRFEFMENLDPGFDLAC